MQFQLMCLKKKSLNMSRRVIYAAHMNAITSILFLPSKFYCKSFQYVTIRNPVDVTAEYPIRIHCKIEIGIEQRNTVIRKLENEYPYMPRTSTYELAKKPLPSIFMRNLSAKGSPNPIE